MAQTFKQASTTSTVDQAAQAAQALFQFLGLSDEESVQARLKRQGTACSLHGAKQPLRAIQEAESADLSALPTTKTSLSAMGLQQARKAAEAMDVKVLEQRMIMVHNAYKTNGAAQGMDEADFLHLLSDCRLFTNKLGLLDGQQLYQAALESEHSGLERKPPGLSVSGLKDAMHRLAAVMLSKVTDKDEAYRRLLCHWVVPHIHQSPSASPFWGLMTPVSMEMLGRYDTTLKRMFAWYASLPNLSGPVSWDQFKNNHRGMLSGHLLLLLTNFKVIPGMLSVRQVTDLLQQYNAEVPSQEGVLQYPHLLEMLCRCAVLLRQQVQRKLSGPCVNITELNSLKRYLRLQSLPSLQDAYALPDSPHHIATITSNMHKMQLAAPTPCAASLPRTPFQHSAVASPVSLSSSYGGIHSPKQRRHISLGFSSAEGAASLGGQQHAARGEGGAGGRSPKKGWDDSGIQLMQSGLSSSVGSDEEERYWEEQGRLKLAEQQQETCKAHLAWREADKRRLLQHRKERLSCDPRMPARLATFPCHMPCTFTPPYALLDPAAPTPTTALNVDGDGWSPMVDVVRLECPSPSPCLSQEFKMSGAEGAAWAQLPMHLLRHVPLDSLAVGSSKLGKRSREAALSHDTSDQLAAFENRLPKLLASWSIEKERQQWSQTSKYQQWSKPDQHMKMEC